MVLDVFGCLVVADAGTPVFNLANGTEFKIRCGHESSVLVVSLAALIRVSLRVLREKASLQSFRSTSL